MFNPAISVAISAVIGAVIGAGTNELAIRWIFRYIMPRKKGDMAVAVRDVLSGDLMSPERLRAKFQDEKFRSVLRDNIRGFLDDLATRELPSPRAMLPDNAASALEKILASLPAEEIRSFISEDKFQSDMLEPFLDRLLSEITSNSPRQLLPGTIDSALEQMPLTVSRAFASERFKAKLADVAADMLYGPLTSNTPLKELLPEEAAVLAQSALKESLPHLQGSLEALLRDPKIQIKLSGFIRSSVRDRFSNVNPEDNILSRGRKMIIDSALEFFDVDGEIDDFCRELPERLHEEMSPDNPGFVKFVDDLTETLMVSPPSKLLVIRDREHLRGLFESLVQQLPADTLGSAFGSILKDALSRAADAEIKTILRFTGAAGPNGDLVKSIGTRLREVLLSEDTGNIISEQCGGFAARFMDRPVGNPGTLLSPAVRKDMTEFLEAAAINTLSERLDDFTRNSGIWDTVVDSIISLDNREMERMTRRIANRELKWVTVLGGLIGLVIGVIQGLLNLYLNTRQ